MFIISKEEPTVVNRYCEQFDLDEYYKKFLSGDEYNPPHGNCGTCSKERCKWIKKKEELDENT
jgi:hypothetical protein